MLGMLVEHAGDVENDAGDVDGLVCVNFAKKCCKARLVFNWPGRTTKQKSQTPKEIHALTFLE